MAPRQQLVIAGLLAFVASAPLPAQEWRWEKIDAVGIKSVDQQGILVLHRSRDLLVRQRTMLSNALRGHMAEFGVIEGLGMAGTARSQGCPVGRS